MPKEETDSVLEELDKALAELGDGDAGWVTRRDAVEVLGKAAVKAVAGLKAFEEDGDRDVRDSVRKALGQASGSLRGIAPVGSSEAPSLESMVQKLERPKRREVSTEGEVFKVHVILDGGRSQDVTISPYTRRDGIKLVRIFTKCGAPSEDSYRWALRSNLKMAQCALALDKEDGNEMLVMGTSFLDGEISQDELKAAVKEVAFYGDWIENKLTGLDEF